MAREKREKRETRYISLTIPVDAYNIIKEGAEIDALPLSPNLGRFVATAALEKAEELIRSRSE